MTTTQAAPNGHRVSPPPCSFPDPQDQNPSEDSTDHNSKSVPASPTPATKLFPASAYHVPPAGYAPKANPYRYDDFPKPPRGPLPERCQFLFSDGRQCTMGRSDIHPSLCTYHSDREEQLFGDPSCSHVARKLDLPELYSASRDLSTAAGVNRALAQVFRLLAQRRISRQEAATFAKLGHLLLQTISAARSECVAAATNSDLVQPCTGVVEPKKAVGITPFFRPEEGERQKAIPSRESHGDQELSRVKEVITPFLPHKKVSEESLRDQLPPEDSLPDRTSSRHENCSAIPSVARPDASNAVILSEAKDLSVALLRSEPPAAPPASKSSEISTCVDSASNSREINTSKNIELNPLQNQHLQKDRRESAQPL